ncbi:hypothetical protein ZWY2020_019749 [Hordeum vulgare]|nr:hypothetical protein ZWY2020_019749 [Hordeum vulgare]
MDPAPPEVAPGRLQEEEEGRPTRRGGPACCRSCSPTSSAASTPAPSAGPRVAMSLLPASVAKRGSDSVVRPPLECDRITFPSSLKQVRPDPGFSLPSRC